MEQTLNVIKNLNKANMVQLIIAVIFVAIIDILSPLFSYIILKILNIKKESKEIKEGAFYTSLKIFFRVSRNILGTTVSKAMLRIVR